MNNRHEVLGRCLAPALRRALSRAPVVVLTGARQTGKTTLARDILGQGRAYVSLDDVEMADRAEREPDTLLDAQVPLTIDEVQRSPGLLLAIKRRVDRKRVADYFGDTLLNCSRAPRIQRRSATEREAASVGVL